jgi:hypothetical protein
VEDATNPEPLSDELLAEAEAESDLLDADLEEFEPQAPVAARQEIHADLNPEELAEAEAESDLVDADIEDA